MRPCPSILLAAFSLFGCLAVAQTPPANVGGPVSPTMGFFVTSEGIGRGGDLDGLSGADRHCQALATRVGAGRRVWRAYLSTTAARQEPAVNARDRIGLGPWANAKGVLIARYDGELHEVAKTLPQISTAPHGDLNNISIAMALDERGRPILPGGEHGVLTGTRQNGTAYAVGHSLTCGNWRSQSEGTAQQGHLDRTGGGPNPVSWNSAEATRGCSQSALAESGNDGRFYCFAKR